MADQAVPPRLLVLPKESTEAARILTLAHPRTSKPSRYYFDPTHGIYEFTRVAAPKAACRSWLLKSQPKGQLAQKEDSKEAPTDQDMTPKEDDQKPTEVVESTPNDYVMKSAEILVATPIDILFILLPSLSDQKLFLSADDLLDRLSERSKHFAHIMAYGPTRQQMEGRLKAVCDTVDAGDEQMYRLNEEKLLAELLLKAKNMVTSGLPASMEERFVRRALDTPLAVVKREEVSISEASQGTDTPMSETTVSETMESQTSTATADSTSTAASAGTEITIPGDVDGKDTTDLKHLLRLRTALSYMLSSYIPSLMAAACVALTASEKSPLDFKPLDTRLAEIARLRAEALAARSIGDFSRKRNMHEEDDAAESRLEKKRRKTEEEKIKKAGETRGIRDLKKVDTKGMKKMGDFFW